MRSPRAIGADCAGGRASNAALLPVESVFFRGAIAGIILLFATSSAAWTVNSRELVDVQFAADDSLVILISAPSAVEPGIYRWQRDAVTPALLCRISSPASFSFDRKTVVERVAGPAPELRLYSPSTCRLLGRIKIEGAVMDADVHGKLVAVALRLPDAPGELRLYGTPIRRAINDKVLARAVIGRNVEMGFAPDGRSIVNFDLSDGGATAWRVPTLAPINMPAWMTDGETTFVPGSQWVKRYRGDTLSVARWPGGTPVYTISAARTVRLRQLSVTGRFGVLHNFEASDPQVASGQSLDWTDFATQRRVRVASGSIDNAAINASGSRVAWASRSAEQANQVSVQFAQINAEGNAIATNGAK